MHVQLIISHFAQLVSAWRKSKYNKYSDSDKQEYHKCLDRLFNELKCVDFSKLSESEREEMKWVLEFFILSLEFLDNSTINAVPFELIECLKYAMSDWIDNSDEYIIVTSYDRFSFDSALVGSDIYPIIESKYGIRFNKKLVQINLPKHLSRDYLTNTVLYHELGHFIDNRLKMAEIIYGKIVQVILDTTHSSDNMEDILNYFPFLKDAKFEDSQKGRILYSHIKEYFADLFASQYVDKSAYYYLEYIADGCPYCDTHPSANDRVKMINEFLREPANYNFVLKTFIEEIVKATERKLEKRYSELRSNDILRLIPCEISCKEQLHHLFHLGWETWLNDTLDFKDQNRMYEHLKPGQIYQIINNLIEKSINNYMVVESWRTAKDVFNKEGYINPN